MPDFVNPMAATMVNLLKPAQTQAETANYTARAQLETQQANMVQERISERQNTMQALQQLVSSGAIGQNDPTLDITAEDSPAIANMKFARRAQKQAMDDYTTAQTIMAQGGDPDIARRIWYDAQKGSERAVQAAREARLSQRSLLTDIGGIAGAVKDQDTLNVAYQQMAQLDPVMARTLPLDRDVTGQPVFSDKTLRVMQGFSDASMTQAQRLDRDTKLQDAQTRATRVNAQAAEYQARADKETAAAEDQRVKTARVRDGLPPVPKEFAPPRSAAAAKVDTVKPASAPQRAAAKATVQAQFTDESFDSTIDALSSDVADRANKIMVEAKQNGEPLGLDEARMQALDELSPFITKKLAGGTTIMGHTFGGKTVTTYVRSKPVGDTPDKPIATALDKAGLEFEMTGGKVTGKGGAPIKVSTQSQRDLLPSGTVYIGPDGKKATKP